MAMKLYNDTNIKNIANAIRTKNNTTKTYKVSEMANAILSIPSLATASGTSSLKYANALSPYFLNGTYTGNVSQDGTPTPDEPVEVKTLKGWNLIGLDTQQYKVDLKAGDKITACNTGTNQLTIQLFSNYGDTTRNDYWTIGSGIKRTITVSYDTKALSWVTSPIGGIAYINKGDYLKPYLPYNSIGVKRIGKNLADGIPNTQIKLIAKVKAGETYTFSTTYLGGASGDTRLQFFTTNYVLTRTTGDIPSDRVDIGAYDIKTQNSKSITPTIDGYLYTRYVLSGLKDYIGTFQLEKGSTATSYEPYQERIDYIDLKGNEVLTTDKLVIENGKCKLVKNWGKVVLDGSNYPLYGGGGSSNDYWEYSRTGMPEGIGTQASVLTNYFNQTTNSRIVILPNGGLYFRFPKNVGIDVSTNTLLNSWLSTHNTIVYYQLATPQEITLDNVSIETLEGTNNAEILATLEPTSMSETYVNDLQAEINEIINAISD